MPSICFVAHNAVPVIFPGHGTTIGGIETGAWTIACEMARLASAPVHFYVRHHRPLPATEKNGVQLAVRVEPWRRIRNDVSICVEAGPGLPTFKCFRWNLLWQLPLLLLTRPFRSRDLPPRTVEPELARVPCDVYVAFGVSPETSRVIATAEATGRRSILLLQSNSDVPPTEPTDISDAGSLEMTRFVLREATAVIGQSPLQAERVMSFCGRRIDCRPAPIDLAHWSRFSTTNREYVLWVGRADDFHKRPRLCIDTARRLPEVPFLMVMNAFDPRIEREIRSRLPPNVQIRESVPFDEMPRVFGGAVAFLSTSSAEYEGFPNVLLQATATGTPVVTMHDFADFVEESGAGTVTGEDLDQVVSALRSIVDARGAGIDRPAVLERLAAAHDLGAYCRRLEALASAISAQQPPRPVTIPPHDE